MEIPARQITEVTPITQKETPKLPQTTSQTCKEEELPKPSESAAIAATQETGKSGTFAFSKSLNDLGINISNGEIGKYEVLEPFLSGLKLTKRVAVVMTPAMIYRRIIFVCVAMFMGEYVFF